ncbi:MAG: hypothetical protein ACRD2W_08155, partial [Acidimicrobiales bacterium]
MLHDETPPAADEPTAANGRKGGQLLHTCLIWDGVAAQVDLEGWCLSLSTLRVEAADLPLTCTFAMQSRRQQ